MKPVERYVASILPERKAKRARSIWTGQPGYLRFQSLYDFFRTQCRKELLAEGVAPNLLAWLVIIEIPTNNRGSK